jgi:hypothetical protein
MEKARRFQHPVSHRDTTEALREMRRPAHAAARIVCGLVVAVAALGPALARAAGSGGCLEGDWIAEARAFVAEETGTPVPKVCVRLVGKERLDGLVFPVSLAESHSEAVAAVYVPATHEILLADDLDPATALARSYLVHELVHAQQFAEHAHERVSCPGRLESDAYGTQGLYLRTKGLREEATLLQALGMLQAACSYSD